MDYVEASDLVQKGISKLKNTSVNVGVDVMITIFRDFFPHFRRKNGVFLESPFYDHFLHKLAVL
jgi:citrate lyase synthetase